MRELSGDDLNYLSVFEKVTHIFPSDYFLVGDSLAFLVEPAQLGKAIGKQGTNVQRLKSMSRKRVFILAASNDPEEMIKRFFSNVKVLSISHQPEPGLLVVTLDEQDRGMAIGKGGERIKLAKEIFDKKFNLKVELKTKRIL
jgi:transcription termination/antitermination protein NusA